LQPAQCTPLLHPFILHTHLCSPLYSAYIPVLHTLYSGHPCLHLPELCTFLSTFLYSAYSCLHPCILYTADYFIFCILHKPDYSLYTPCFQAYAPVFCTHLPAPLFSPTYLHPCIHHLPLHISSIQSTVHLPPCLSSNTTDYTPVFCTPAYTPVFCTHLPTLLPSASLSIVPVK
jgi:hypothetical protein